MYVNITDIHLLTHTIYTRNNMGQKCEGNCGLWVLNKILKRTYPENFKNFIKNPQTTIALTFLTHIISGIDGVSTVCQKSTSLALF